jgi:hypothetical protein
VSAVHGVDASRSSEKGDSGQGSAILALTKVRHNVQRASWFSLKRRVCRGSGSKVLLSQQVHGTRNSVIWSPVKSWSCSPNSGMKSA